MNNVIIVTYDISNDKTRTQFSKFLEKYGVRIQFSVFEIKNSKRILDIVQHGINTRFSKKFEPGDSIYVFKANHNDTQRYGSADLLDADLIII